MLNIPYNPKAFIFTSYLPDTVEIVSDAPSVKVDVKCDDELVFTATFYPYEGLATLHDVCNKLINFAAWKISSNEYRTILLAVDHDNFIQCKNVLLLNSFLKKGTKQYKAEIKKAENIIKRYLED